MALLVRYASQSSGTCKKDCISQQEEKVFRVRHYWENKGNARIQQHLVQIRIINHAHFVLIVSIWVYTMMHICITMYYVDLY